MDMEAEVKKIRKTYEICHEHLNLMSKALDDAGLDSHHDVLTALAMQLTDVFGNAFENDQDLEVVRQILDNQKSVILSALEEQGFK